MASAAVVIIEGTPELSTTNSAGDLIEPGKLRTIWNATGDYVDGTGSTNPITLRIPPSDKTPYTPALTVGALITFTSAYSGAIFSLEGSLRRPDGTETVILMSTGNLAPPSIPNPPVAVPMKFSKFEFAAGLILPDSCPVPFRYSGDFNWKLVFIAPLPPIPVRLATRLEICYARAKAPSGPSYTANPATSPTRVDLGGVYPISLIRLFFPRPDEFASIPNFTKSATYGPWFAAHVVSRVWTWGNPETAGGPQYDALDGESFYGVNAYGGSFALEAWHDVRFKKCNCYDLAGIVQLGCCLLLGSNGSELLDSHWVFHEPHGYIPSGLLYGWSRYPYPPGVNNPFFLDTKPNLPAHDPDRSHFKNHAWVEVLHDPYIIGTRTVLDACTAVPDSKGICHPSSGNAGRIAYGAACIDAAADPTPLKKRTGNLLNRILPPPSTGDCYENYDYYLTNSKHLKMLGRIGVYDAEGITIPALLAGPEITSGAADSMSEVEILLAKGQNPNRPPGAFMNASMGRDYLNAVIGLGDDNLRLRESRIKVADGITNLSLTFEGARYTESKNALVVIEFNVFNTFATATLSLTHALLSVTPGRRLSEHFLALASPVAEISLVSIRGQTLHFVRGNCHVQMRIVPDEVAAPDPAVMQRLEPIAQRLDGYLAGDTVPPGQQRHPDLSLNSPVPQQVSVGDRVRLETNGQYAAMSGKSTNGGVVVFAGISTGSCGTEFLAVDEGWAELSLHVAHPETLIPAKKTVEVTVSRSD